MSKIFFYLWSSNDRVTIDADLFMVYRCYFVPTDPLGLSVLCTIVIIFSEVLFLFSAFRRQDCDDRMCLVYVLECTPLPVFRIYFTYVPTDQLRLILLLPS